jgi:flavin reductase (DIM6/NTAB) family NADH-FMN oxidoreductase RutF
LETPETKAYMLNKKKEIPISKSTSLINPGCVVLASMKPERHKPTNIITLAWQTPLSINPKLLGISIGFKRYSHHLTEQAGEFVINIPDKSILQQVHGCGRVSGRDMNKFTEFNLHEEPSREIKSSGIQECVGIIECKVENQFVTGDHTFFVGKVVHAKVDEEAWDFQKNCWKQETANNLLYHLGSNKYLTSGELVEV